MNFLELPIQVLDHGNQLSILLVLLLHQLLELPVFLLKLADEFVAFLELLLDRFEFHWVSKGVLRPHDFFELLAEAGALVDVNLDFDLDFL